MYHKQKRQKDKKKKKNGVTEKTKKNFFCISFLNLK